MGLHPAERVREYRAKGYWNDDMIDALFRARLAEFGDVPAIVDPPNRETLTAGPARTLTWTQADDEVSRLAQVLLDEGIAAGDVVGIQLPNTVEIALAFLAIVRIGAIVAPFPVQYRAYELTHLSNVAKVRLFITATRIGQRPAAAEIAGLREQIPSLRAVAAFGPGLPAGVIGLDERITAAASHAGLAAHLAVWSPDPNDCVTICWTSGTESTPKGVQRTHYDWMAMGTGTVEGPGLTADDVLLNPFPMVNMAGISGMFLPWLKVGGLLLQHHPFDLATFLRQIEQYRATYTVAPPALLTMLLHNEALLAHADISSLRLLGSGSTPLAPSLLQGWHDKHGIEIINFYGSNEGIALLGLPKDIPDPAVRASYFPRYGAKDRVWSFAMARWTQARIVDTVTGQEITEAGVPGELQIKGPGVFPGYLPASGVPDPFEPDGFLKTGDILEIAGDGLEYLHYVDRAADMVVRGGMKISAAELETFVSGHPKVADVAVAGYPDDVLGERACVIVVPQPGETVTLAEIVGYLRGIGIATFKLPERLEIRTELPRNPLGKILKRELRDELRQR
ncbi:MAG TPA: class I adenylate-forming enzyme family protein [Streptosporangiaceae bacterium]